MFTVKNFSNFTRKCTEYIYLLRNSFTFDKFSPLKPDVRYSWAGRQSNTSKKKYLVKLYVNIH
jgi:hypothetical protein